MRISVMCQVKLRIVYHLDYTDVMQTKLLKILREM